MVHEHEVFFHHNYLEALRKDFREARSLVIMQSPFLGTEQVGLLLPDFKSCLNRGVQVCVFIEKPDPRYKQDEWRAAATNQCIKRLLSLGNIHITRRPLIHEKFALFDEQIAWEGTLNFLSHVDKKERITRWICKQKFWEIVSSHNLDSCPGCKSVSGFCQRHPDHERSQRIQLGSIIANRRREFGLSQRELATKVGLRQADVSIVESGERAVKLSKVLKICSALRLGLRPIPWYLLPVTDEAILKPKPVRYVNPQNEQRGVT